MASTRNTLTAGPARTRRPLTARSVLASTLLGLDPPALRTSALVAGAELLGVSPGTARVAISRMVAAGELEPTDDGYRLAGHLLARRRRQDLSRQGTPDGWDGTWSVAVVPPDARDAASRAALRRAMGALRHAEVRDGVWMRPANLPAGTLPDAEAAVADQLITLRAEPEDPPALARRLWDLDGWASDARELLAEVEPLDRRLADDDASALAESFVVAAAVLRHLQSDPLLPRALLPADWPGDDLRARHADFEGRFRVVLRDWHRRR